MIALELSAYGITAQLPEGWEGTIAKRDEPGPDARTPEGAPLGAERTYPIMHIGNFPLPADRGDFGSGAVETMGEGDVFVCLFEYGPESVGQPLFAPQGMPRTIDPTAFSAAQLQRTLRGQAGYQTFFTEGGRAFTLFVVLGSRGRAGDLSPVVDAALAAITIEPR